MAKVSVVITTIGRPELSRAVESALSQDYKDIEIIVVGPSGEYDLPKKIRHLNSEKSINVCKARNIGTQASTGDFIAYLDDDDYWHPSKISVQVEEFSKQPPKTILGCRSEAWGPIGKSVYPRQLIAKEQSVLSYLFGEINFLPGLRFFQTSGIILATADARRIGWDEDIPRHNDWDFILRAQAHGFGFEQLADILVVVDQGGDGSISRNCKPEFSDAFYERYKTQMSRREESAFLLTAVFQSALNSRNFSLIAFYAVRIIRLNTAPKTIVIVLLRIINIRKIVQISKQAFRWTSKSR
jgi:glycosyltransferase involved in cell wall biosynthesis